MPAHKRGQRDKAKVFEERVEKEEKGYSRMRKKRKKQRLGFGGAGSAEHKRREEEGICPHDPERLWVELLVFGTL